jgi:hypothetical protein
VTLQVTVSDPAGALTGNALVTIAYNGISALYNNTLAAPAVTGNWTIGTTYTLTATLYKALGGGGFAKFTATKTGGYSGYTTWWASSAWADMAADLILAIGNNQGSSDVTAKASLVVNTAENADSMKWIASASSQPAKATVIASGTSVSTGPPFYVADLGVTLSLGDTVYVTVVLYDYAGAVMDKSFEAKATRANLSRSKTIQWAAAGNFHAYTVAKSGFIPPSGLVTPDRSIDELFYGFIEPSSAITVTTDLIADLTHSWVLADGGTLTGILAEVWTELTAAPTQTDVDLELFAVALGSYVGDASPIASLTGTHTGGWQTVSNEALDQSTTGRRFVVHAKIWSTGRTGPAGGTVYAKFRSLTITYLPDNLQATI